MIPLLALAAFVLTRAGLQLGTRLAPRWGLVDAPDLARKAHGAARPVVGAALWLGSSIAWAGGPADPLLLTWTLAGTAILLVGLDDDRHGRGALWKLLGQLGIAAAAVGWGGLGPRALTLGPWSWELGAWGPIWAVLWLVALTNAFNLVDGSDGLAVGIAAWNAAGLLLAGLPPGGVPLAAALLGSAAGFWPVNRPPARVFLGDGGSYWLGFSLGLLSLAAAGEAFALERWGLFFLVPLGDTTLAIWRRLRAGRSIFAPDREHVHHRLERRWGSWPMLGLLYALTLAGMLLSWGMTRLWE